MSQTLFDRFFTGEAASFLLQAVDAALAEDGVDLTSRSIFGPGETLDATIVAKEPSIVAGLPLIRLVCDRIEDGGTCLIELHVEEGCTVEAGTVVAALHGPARTILKAERVVLNFVCHLSGIANLTRRYVQALASTRTKLLDTRKTLPGLRYPEKYAVLLGGGLNHRKNLAEMIMIKDNHIDRAGSITEAVARVRSSLDPCPPIEVECRNRAEVIEAVGCRVDRIMLDNMGLEAMAEALTLVPASIETEASGGVGLEGLAAIGRIGPDFVSVGRITHSAPVADFSMRIATSTHS